MVACYLHFLLYICMCVCDFYINGHRLRLVFLITTTFEYVNDLMHKLNSLGSSWKVQ